MQKDEKKIISKREVARIEKEILDAFKLFLEHKFTVAVVVSAGRLLKHGDYTVHLKSREFETFTIIQRFAYVPDRTLDVARTLKIWLDRYPFKVKG